MRQRFCKYCRGWHDLDAPWPDNCLPERNMKRADLPSPMLIIDTMQPVQSMLDGKMYDSKSALRATYKAAGVVEVGNDPQRYRPKPKPKVDRKQVKDSLERAAARYKRGERSNKAPVAP
jgi:hypothetical protein